MPGLFNNPVKTDNSFIEATVITVDAIRFTCQVKTVLGQLLGNVSWTMPIGGSSRSGDHHTPKYGDRVLITYATGYPIIIGAISRPGDDAETFPIHIDSGHPPEDTGSYTNVNKDLIANPNKPMDLHIGDHVKTTEGGGLSGSLRGGSFIAKASRLAQIFITKYDDLVRIIGRNLEVFTDVCVDVCASVRGQIYRYIGYGNKVSDSRAGTYVYEEFYGNTAAAEALKDQYVMAGSAPEDNGIVRKYKAGAMTEILATGGNLTRTTGTAILNHNTDMYKVSVNGTAIVTIVGDSITVQHTGGSTVTVDGSQIQLFRNGGSTVTVTDDSIIATKGASTTTVQDANTTIVNGGSTLTVADANITAVNGGATLTVKDGNSSLMVGGHGVIVTSGGVSFQ